MIYDEGSVFFEKKKVGKDEQKPCEVCQNNRQEIFESDYIILWCIFRAYYNRPQCRKLAFRQWYPPFTIPFSMVFSFLFLLLLLFFASFLLSSLITDILYTLHMCNMYYFFIIRSAVAHSVLEALNTNANCSRPFFPFFFQTFLLLPN